MAGRLVHPVPQQGNVRPVAACLLPPLTCSRTGDKLVTPLGAKFGASGEGRRRVSKRCARILFAIAAAVLAAVLGVTSALAATTWTVRPGGSISLKSATLVLTDAKTHSNIVCASSRLSGRLKSGSGLSGSGIGSITAGSFTTCNNSLGPTFTLTMTDLPWPVNFTSYNASKGVATGSFSHIQIKVMGPSCAAVIDGTSGTASDGIVKLTYTSSTAKLKPLATGGNLHFYNVSGCYGLLINGDPVTLSATFTVSPKQAITSP